MIGVRPLSLIAGAILLLAAFILHIRFARDNARGERSLAWPVTTGLITHARIQVNEHRTQPTDYVDDIEYLYTVAGHDYRSRSIDLRIRNVNDRDAMSAFVGTYHEGQPVSVHYDPQDPADTLLVAGPDLDTSAPRLLASKILLVAGICLLIVAITVPN